MLCNGVRRGKVLKEIVKELSEKRARRVQSRGKLWEERYKEDEVRQK